MTTYPMKPYRVEGVAIKPPSSKPDRFSFPNLNSNEPTLARVKAAVVDKLEHEGWKVLNIRAHKVEG